MNHSQESLYQPAEWAPHRACWSAWPSHEDLWQESLPEVQREFAAFCHAIGSGSERLEILVAFESQLALAEKALAGLNVRFHLIPFGDIWLRDTASIFLKKEAQIVANRFRFNGWGEKYVLPFDDDVSRRVAQASGYNWQQHGWILEGGALETDGEGTCITTRQCLLNSNRSFDGKSASEIVVEERLKSALGYKKILWLNEGLLNDHTDGHVDNLARFIAPGVVVCMEAKTQDDPNAAILRQIYAELSSFQDAQGRKLKVVQIPSPGRILNEDGDVVPASHMNFYIGNDAVAVPTYEPHWGAQAVEILKPYFPGRKVVGLSAQAILGGGGAFHCITQQEPL